MLLAFWIAFQLPAQQDIEGNEIAQLERLLEQKKHAELISACNEHLAADAKTSWTPSTMAVHYYRAKAWMDLDSFALVIKHVRPVKGAPILNSQDYQSYWVDCMYQLASAYEYAGDVDSSIYFFKMSLNGGQNLENPDYKKLGKTCSYIGYLYCYVQQNFREGEHFYLKEEEMLRSYDAEDLTWVRHYLNLAGTYSSRDYQKALNHNINTLSFIKRIPNNADYLVTVYNNIGNLYFRQGKYHKAIRNYNMAQEKFLYEEELGDVSPAFLYENMGACYKRLGISDSSELFYTKAYELNKAEYGPNSIESAESLFLLSSSILDNDKDSKMMSKAIRNLESHYQHQNYGLKRFYNLAAEKFYADGLIDSALYYYSLNLGVVSKSNFLEVPSIYLDAPVHISNPLRAKANILLSLGFEKDSIECIRSAINHYKALSELMDEMLVYRSSELERVDYMQSSLKAYEKAVEACFYMYQYDNSGLDDLWFFMEKSRSSVLMLQSKEAQEVSHNQALAESRRKLKGQRQLLERLLRDKVDKEDSIRVELYSINEQIDVLNDQLGLQVGFEKMRSQNLELSSAKDFVNKSEKEGIVQFYQTDEAVYVFTINKEEVFVKRIEGPALQQLKHHIANLKSFLREGLKLDHLQHQFDEYTKSAFYLHQQLLADFANELENLNVISDGYLSDIPFEILLAKPPTDKAGVNYRNLQYLIKDLRITYAYSFSWLLGSIEAEYVDFEEYPKVLAFAYSNESGSRDVGQKVDLSASAREVQSIEKIWPGEVSSFVGDEASEQNFKRNQKANQILHLATHNVVDTLNFLNSGLVFRDSEDSDEDGLVHTYEIDQLVGPKQLVVLSACESAMGDYVEGEGYFSVGRAFAQLGTPYIISSLWQASDVYSSDIMTLFYTNLAMGKNPPSALRASKLKVLNSCDELSAHPSNWASFVSMGSLHEQANARKRSLKPIVVVGIGALLLSFVIIRRKRSA